MKTIFLSLLLMLSSQLLAQTNTERYIQLVGDVETSYYTKIWSIDYPSAKRGVTDTLVNYKAMYKTIEKNRNAITVINELAKEGWVLVSTAFIPNKEPDLTGKGKMVYFLKKSF